MSTIPYPRSIVKWSAAKSASASMAARLLDLDDIKYRMRGSRMADCASRITYTYCRACGSLHVSKTNLCRDRLCPLCAWRLSLQRVGELMQVLDLLYEQRGGVVQAAMLTLTIKNVPMSDLSPTITTMLKAWDKLLKRANVRKWVSGYGRSLEITRGADGSYHPHIHALIIWSEGYAKDIVQAEWVRLWQSSLGVAYRPIVDIRAAYSRNSGADAWQRVQTAAIEATKYALKGDILAAVPQADLQALADAVAGRRLLSYGGVLRDLRADLKFSAADAAFDVADTSIDCPKCGATDTVLLSYQWATSGVGYQPIGYPVDHGFDGQL